MGIFDPKRISTQEHLDIADIKDDMVVLKSGKVSIVIETTSLNFDLLDGPEQDAKIGSFAAFLNATNFPVQIVIKTQRTDIANYLKLLESYKSKITSTAVTEQVSLYQDFINNLTQTTQILDKRFYTVIPSLNLPVIKNNWFKETFGTPERIAHVTRIVEKAKEELYPKRDSIIKQYQNMGVAAKQLTNDELIKLYYSVYEPDKLGLEILNLRDSDVSTGIVRSS
ncbi:MAG: hypothetical protein ABI721_00260 [Candidatus Dojkabacteria bacterium]